jgi:cobalt-zinc-cadmium efflux system outer membrane protein
VFVERDALAYRGTGLPGAPVGSRALESPRIGLGVSLPVPLFDRNQGVVAERAAQAEQARLRRSATELAVRTQVTDAYRAYLAASEEARVFARDVLQPARTNQQLLETAFRAGKVGLPTLVLLRNQLLDAELGYWDAWLSERNALVALEAATATLDLDLNLNPSEGR